MLQQALASWRERVPAHHCFLDSTLFPDLSLHRHCAPSLILVLLHPQSPKLLETFYPYSLGNLIQSPGFKHCQDSQIYIYIAQTFSQGYRLTSHCVVNISILMSNKHLKFNLSKLNFRSQSPPPTYFFHNVLHLWSFRSFKPVSLESSSFSFSNSPHLIRQ